MILSPHRDDAAFSCGLLLTQLARCSTRLTVVNVCTESDYAPYLPPGGQDRTRQVTAERAVEDCRFSDAVAVLSGTRNAMDWIDLQWEDAPLRLGIATPDVLQPVSAPAQDITVLCDAFASLVEADVVLAPLALGDHIDHRLVRDAALRTFGERVVLYEDLPYACRMGSVDRSSAVHERVPADFQVWSLATAAAGMKRRLAMCYPSQIAPDVADEMEAYADQGGSAERFYGRETLLRRLERAASCGVA